VDDLERRVKSESLAPIVHEYALSCSADHAFDTYTTRIRRVVGPPLHGERRDARDRRHRAASGGRVFARHRDIGDEDDWGEVTLWEPGRMLAHTFRIRRIRARSR
jgi:hypothetical protein